MLPGVNEAASAITDEIKSKLKEFGSYVLDYHKNLEQLRNKHDDLVARKDDIRTKVEIGEERLEKITHTTDAWLKKVQTLIEDEEVNRLKDKEGNKKKDSSCFKIIPCGVCHRYKTSKAAHDKTQEIEVLLGEGPSDPVTLPPLVRDLKGIPSEFLKGLQSRERLLQLLLEKLQTDAVDVVGLCGMGGTGKTTLAKEVADDKAKSTFDTIVMVEISEAPNAERIQDQIAEALGLPLDDKFSTPQRATKLYNRLKQADKGKKQLIILDNIWRKLNLDEVGIPRDSCKLLLTSREEDVCKTMGVQESNILRVDLLNEMEARDLFQHQIGKRVDTGEYKSVADRLLNKCGGLPLAIVTTANSLKGKDFPMWRQFADELEKPLSSQVRGVHRETYRILRTSYEVMESEEQKMFFLLACLSPLGSSISIETLMRYGIGLDLFQHVNSLSEAMDQASTWANELVSSSMLLVGDFANHVKIHDVVRASTISFAAKADTGKDGHVFLVETIPRWMSEGTFNKYTAMSLSSGYNFSRLDGVKANKLEILILKGNLSYSSGFSDDFFRGMTNLKVLALSTMRFERSLPKSIGLLENLRTLHLERCRLGDIKMICNLMNLLVLSLRESFLKELPTDEIVKLHNLRLLDMRECRGKQPKKLADAIACLSNLEGVYLLGSFKESLVTRTKSDDGRTCFRKLSHLDVLEVHVPDLAQLSIDSRIVKNMSKFAIYVGGESPQKYEQELIRQYRHALMLVKVDITRVVKDICLNSLLKKADCLEIHDCKTPVNLVPELDEEGFKGLSSIRVIYCNDIKTLICIYKMNDLNAFPKLEKLELSKLWNLEKICDGEAPPGTFLNLSEICLFHLPELKYVLPFIPRNLTKIEVAFCNSLEFLFIENASLSLNGDADENKETNVVELPCLRNLEISKAQNLVSMLGQVKFSAANDGEQEQAFFSKKVELPSLELLRLYSVDKIEKLWSKKYDTSSFQNLKDIEILYCRALLSMGQPFVFSALLQLERLSIRSCDMMEEVIAKETEGVEITDQVIRFSQLKELELAFLPNLQSFYAGSYKLEFPKLQKLRLSVLTRMITFAASENSTVIFSDKMTFPCLEMLEMDALSNAVKELSKWHPFETDGMNTPNSNPFPKLRKLMLGNMPLLVVPQNLSCLQLSDVMHKKFLFSTSVSTANNAFVWTYSQLSKLEELSVKNCRSLERLFEDEDNSTTAEMGKFCGQLKQLRLSGLYKLERMPLYHYKSLVSLHLFGLNWEYVFSADMVTKGSRLLPLLEDVSISGCGEMKVVIQDKQEGGSKDKVVEFPRLKSLYLFYLSKAINFSSRPDVTICLPSLETLKVDSCTELGAFWSGSFVAPKLREVKLRDCSNLQWFLSGGSNTQVLDFQSLQRVLIKRCPEMKGFLTGYRRNPGDVLELPSLRQVELVYCAKLQSFYSGALRVPELAYVEIDYQEYSIQEVNDINQFLASRYTRIHSERQGNLEEGSREGGSEGEINEEISEDE